MAFFGLFGRNRTRGQADTNAQIDGIINGGNSSNPQLNPEFRTFKRLTQDIDDIISSRSVLAKVLDTAVTTGDFFTAINSLDVLPVITNKYQRLQQWRNASAFQEVDFCLREIADDFIHYDENGDFIKLILNENKESLNDARREILENEFRKFIALFNFRKNSFNLVRRFLIEGELAWENVINPEKPELGIQAVKFIPAEYYESLVDPKTGEKVGIFIDAQKLEMDIRTIVSSTYYNSYKAFNSIYGTTINAYSNNTCIPFLWPQVTYISSPETTPDGLVPLSLLEKCKQAYYQLALMQDAAVVMRVTRAPEKLLFNIDVSGMPTKIAEDRLRKFARDLFSKKIIANPNELAKEGKDGTPNVTSVYHPSSMNTAWVFGKTSGSEGTSVETVGSTANFEQMEDIDYFLRRLLKQADVPYSRYKTPENTIEKNDSITYEEYSFSRQEIRFQDIFAGGLENGFITHLKLRQLWDKYDLKDSDLRIEFTAPILYELYQNQKLLEAKMAAYATIADREEFSKIYAMKTVLKMSEQEIKENFDNLVREGMLMKKVEWAQDQLGEKGPKDDTLPVPLKGDEDEDENESGEENGEELGGEGGEEGEEPSGEEGNEEAEGGETEEKADSAGGNIPDGFGLG